MTEQQQIVPAALLMRAEVLVVEDDPEFRELVATTLRRRGYSVHVAPSVTDARSLLARRAFDVALIDVQLGDGSGLDLVDPLRAVAGSTQFVVMSGYADSMVIEEAMRRGAFKFVEKPASAQQLVTVVGDAARQAELVRENVTLRAVAAGEATATIPIERLGKAMRDVHARATRAAQLDVPVLIHGESGTGKEFVARAIHAASSRAKAILLPINCGAFKPELVQSELFGHEKGAFAAATDRRIGLVEVARGGTILLDEIAEFSPDAQVAILRFIEQQEYRRVGGTEILKSDVRIIAATHRDLQQAVAAGRFREDLYFRLAVLTIRVPPLRERPDDIPIFVSHFLRLRGHTTTFRPEVIRALSDRAWPGNVRELRNTVDRLVMEGDPPDITLKNLDVDRRPVVDTQARDLTLAEVEREHILRILERASWNRTRAAQTLGISARTLYRKIQSYRLERR